MRIFDCEGPHWRPGEKIQSPPIKLVWTSFSLRDTNGGTLKIIVTYNNAYTKVTTNCPKLVLIWSSKPKSYVW